MPKKQEISKSQSIRNYIQANPHAANKDVADALNKQGIGVTVNLISTVKNKMSARKGKRRRRQQAAEVAAVKTGIGVAEIKAAFGLLKACGSIAAARDALAAALEIQKVL
jgi:hypothetical protein